MRETLLKGTLLFIALLAAGMAGALIGQRHAAPFGAAVAAESAGPGMVPIPLSTPLTENLTYPPSVPVGSFDGAYKMATVYKSAVYAGNRVAFWESEAGGLRSFNYPKDEFIYVLEGSVVTTDSDGTKHEFHAGDTFVLPKGWVGLWDMKTRFKKIIVNF